MGFFRAAFGSSFPERLRFSQPFAANSYAGRNGIVSVGYDSDGQVRHHQYTRQPLLGLEISSQQIAQKYEAYVRSKWEGVRDQYLDQDVLDAWALDEACKSDIFSDSWQAQRRRDHPDTQHAEREAELNRKAEAEGLLRSALSERHAEELESLSDKQVVHRLEALAQEHVQKVYAYRDAYAGFKSTMMARHKEEYGKAYPTLPISSALFMHDVQECYAAFFGCAMEDVPIWLQDNGQQGTDTVCMRFEDPEQIPLFMRSLHQFGTGSAGARHYPAEQWEQMDEDAHDYALFTLGERNLVKNALVKALAEQQAALESGAGKKVASRA